MSSRDRFWRNPLVDVDYEDFTNDLITRALKIGATHLSLQFDQYHPEYVLPKAVFEAENLVELSVEGCNFDNLGCDRKVRCSSLVSLSLCYVNIRNEMISDIASYCPLIEKLSLCNLSSFDDDYDGGGGGSDIHYSFLGDLSSIFLSLKDLTLRGCKTQEVSSRSLERINFATGYLRTKLSVKFDLPNIRKFRFEDVDIPSLSFVTAPREWESDVFITDRYGSLSTLWFRSLNKFLTESSLSRIYLTPVFSFDYYTTFEYEERDIRGLSRPKLENLTINDTCLSDLRCFVIFHGLFQICRPKFITLDYKSMYGERERIGRTDLLGKTLARGLDDKCMYGLHDLDEVNVHLFDEDVDVWRPLPLKSFLDPSLSPKGYQTTSS